MLRLSIAMRHPRRDPIRLRRDYRYFLYFVFGLLFISGAAWGYFNYLSPRSEDFEQAAKSLSMKIHGAMAMATLVLIGAMLTTHVRFSWRANRNRFNGTLFLTTLGILIVTGYGLYYAGNERLRAWTSWIHLAVGLALPGLLFIHIMVGRRTRPLSHAQKPQPIRHLPAKIDI